MLYFEKKELHLITKHKIDYFLEYLRSRLYVTTQDLEDETFLRNLALRSNSTLEEVKNLMGMINKLRAKQHITEEELKNLNKKIEAFKANVDGK